MRIDPNIENAARALLGNAIRGDWDAYAEVIEDTGEERFLECLSLCLRIAGYIAIDVCGHRWPADGELRDIARRMASADLNLGLTETAVYDYLAQCALGFRPLADAFPDPKQAASIPVSATAALLVSYRRHGTDWWDYLERIERGLEEAAGLPDDAFPAALLQTRRKHALNPHAAAEADGA